MGKQMQPNRQDPQKKQQPKQPDQQPGGERRQRDEPIDDDEFGEEDAE